jgi:ABC-2 type transport system permease protein
MPIFEQTYRKWDGEFKKGGFKWLPITTVGIRQTFKKKKFLLFFILCLSPILVFAIMMVIRAIAPSNINVEIDFFQIGPTFFLHFLRIQFFFTFFITLWVGSNLVNDDYRTNALQLYLSKPLSTHDYIIGKLSIVTFFVLSITGIPALLLFIMRILILPEKGWLLTYWWLSLGIIGFSLTLAIACSLFIIFLSSITKNSRFTGVSYFLVYIFSSAIAEALYGITRENLVLHISVNANLDNLFVFFFGNAGTKVVDSEALRITPVASILILAIVSVFLYFVTYKRVSKIEVIS